MCEALGRVLAWILVAGFVLSGTGASAQSPDTAEYRAMLDQYCIACHNARTMAGGLSLAELELDLSGSNAQVWEKVLQKLLDSALLENIDITTKVYLKEIDKL